MEQDPREVLFAVKACIKDVVRKFDALGLKVDQIVTIGITNQRETTVAWDATTGEPLYNAIGVVIGLYYIPLRIQLTKNEPCESNANPSYKL